MTREEAIKNIKKALPMSKTLEEAFYTLHPELCESEDERIRKEIIEYLWDISNQTPLVKESLDCRRWIAYLEKQKESLHISKLCKENADSFTDEDERIRKAIIELLKEVGQDDTGISENAKCMIAYLEKQKEQKPAEWSEEDEDKLEQCIRIVSGWEKDYDIVKSPYSNFLKSLHPSWKPSKEQMEALEYFIRSWGESGTMSPQNPILCAANSLLINLKKLI